MNTHPLVKHFFLLKEQHEVSTRDLERTSGVSKSTINEWQWRCSPQLVSFEAALNAMGYELRILKRR